MKPIGIGQLKKATQQSGRTPAFDQRHSAQSTKETGTAITLKTSPSQGEEQEGQLSVDVIQTDTEIIIIAPVAGTSSEELNLSITDDVITIKGRRQIPTSEALNENDFYIQECFWGNFSRSIVLPAAVDTRNVAAHFKNNVLTIRIPKTENIRTRVIKIEE